MDQDDNDMTTAGRPGAAGDGAGSADGDPLGPGDGAGAGGADGDPLVAPDPGNEPVNGSIPRPARRPATALLTWGIVALVLVIVVVLVVIKVTGTSDTTTNSGPSPSPAPTPVVHAVTGIPSSVYDTVGVTSPDAAITAPTLLPGTDLLEKGGKPEIVYVGDEFCPYCAAERWALVAALSRFGTFTNLDVSQSGTNEAFPGTPTFSFAGTTYASRYLSATLTEHYGDQKNAAGTGYAVLDPLSSSEKALLARYDRTKTGAVVPFLDIAGRAVLAGGDFSPSILQQLTSTQIATGLTDPKDPATEAIVSAANEIAAVICSADGQLPTSVCAGNGVVAASSALGLSA